MPRHTRNAPPSTSPYSVELIPGSNPPEFLITRLTPQIQLGHTKEPKKRAKPKSAAPPASQVNYPYPQPGTSSYPQDGIPTSLQPGMPHNRVALNPAAQPVRPSSNAPPPPHPQNRAPGPMMSMHPSTLQQLYQSTQPPPRFAPEHEEVARRVNAAARQRGGGPLVQRAPLPYPETPPQPIPAHLLSGGLPYPETARQDAQRVLDRMRGRTANVQDQRFSEGSGQRR